SGADAGERTHGFSGTAVANAHGLVRPRFIELNLKIELVLKELDPGIRRRTAQENEIVTAVEIAELQIARGAQHDAAARDGCEAREFGRNPRIGVARETLLRDQPPCLPRF